MSTQVWKTTVVVEYSMTSTGWTSAHDVIHTMSTQVEKALQPRGNVTEGLMRNPQVLAVRFERATPEQAADEKDD